MKKENLEAAIHNVKEMFEQQGFALYEQEWPNCISSQEDACVKIMREWGTPKDGGYYPAIVAVHFMIYTLEDALFYHFKFNPSYWTSKPYEKTLYHKIIKTKLLKELTKVREKIAQEDNQ